MTKGYAIQATVSRTVDDYFATFGVPMFYLLPNVQGITSEEHAVRIAESVLNPTNDPQIEVRATALLVDILPNA